MKNIVNLEFAKRSWVNSASVFISLLLLFGCSSGKKLLEKGNYYQSVLQSVERLRKNPDHRKSSETLNSAYPLALQFHENRANNMLASNNRGKWKGVLDAYTKINHMYEEINRSPGALRTIPNPKNYYAELEQARNNAAKESYNLGMQALGVNTKASAKEAYYYFKEANGFVRGYKDVVDKIDQAFWLAATKVVVEPIPVPARNFEISAEFFENKINENLRHNSGNEFVRFFTPSELASSGRKADHILKLSFDDFTVGQVFYKERQIPMTKDSVVLGTVKTKEVVATGQNNVTTKTPKTNPIINNKQGKVTNLTNTPKQESGNKPNQNQGNDNKGNDNQGADNKGADNKGADNKGNDKGNGNKGTDNKGNDNKGNDNKGNDNQGNDNKGNDNKGNDNQGNDNKGTDNNENVKITICHIPPGNPNNKQTLTISESALQAHINHGDVMGSCADTSKDTGDKQTDDKEVGDKATGDKDTGDKDTGDKDTKDKETRDKETSDKDKGDKDSGDKDTGDKDTVDKDTDGDGYGKDIKDPQDQQLVDKEYKVYGTVKATIYHYSKTIRSAGVMDFRIVDANTEKILTVEKMPGEFTWFSEWATFNGDERALTEEQLKLSKQKEIPPPPPQDLFIEFTKPIYDQIINKVKNYYRNY